MNPQNLKEELTNATGTDRVYYDDNLLREWVNGNRFYLRSKSGGSSNSDTQYFGCESITTDIAAVRFSNRDVKVKTVETEKQNFGIGFLDGDPVIVSADPEHFWK